MWVGLDPLWDSCERAEFYLDNTTDVNISVTGCKVRKCYGESQAGGVGGGAGGLRRGVGCAGGS